MFDRVRSQRYWVLQAGLALCWIGTWQLGRILELSAFSSLWFPPAAMTFALFLAEGRFALPAVTTGVLVTNFEWASLHGDQRGLLAVLVTGLAFCVAHCLAYWLGAGLFDRLDKGERFGTPLSVVGFLTISSGSALLAAVAGIGSMVLSGAAEGGFTADLIPWWIGDLVAVVTLAPAFLVLIDRATNALGLPSSGWSASLKRLGPSGTPAGGFVVKLAVTLTVVLCVGELAAVGEFGVPAALLVYVVIVPLMWIAHTEGGLRTVIAVAVLATAVVALTRSLGLTEQAFNYQAAMITIAGAGLFNLTVPRLYVDNRKLLNLVTFDQLTGARTRQAFLAAAEEALADRHRNPRAISLLTFDIDHFKAVNDSLGHAAGDAVLAAVGEICRRELRGIDLFGRLGGEEFAVLVRDADRDATAVVAERLRESLATAKWGPRLEPLKVTASFGVVAVEPEEKLRGALERADRALYMAKRAGRDRVCML